ncbi:MAG: hypothetical protein PUJ19_01920 [Campylobacteraceae bacterium]|nr:hypothetical protein [Campylobacteraceae bacterium]MDY4120683.1 hypothetical protein [Campylobacter sp.]
MNKNKMLNDKPIFVAKRRTFYGLIRAAIGLILALFIYSVAQESEADKLKQVVGWAFSGLFCIGVVAILYTTLIFKKIMLFDDRIEVHFVNKVIVRTYSQIKSCYIYKGGYVWSITKQLFLKCEPKFMNSYLNSALLHKKELYKIKENLIKKGVKDDDWI